MTILLNNKDVEMLHIRDSYIHGKCVVNNKKANQGCKWSWWSVTSRVLALKSCSPNAFNLVSNTIIAL